MNQDSFKLVVTRRSYSTLKIANFSDFGQNASIQSSASILSQSQFVSNLQESFILYVPISSFNLKRYIGFISEIQHAKKVEKRGFLGFR